jgi:hypothetical protein
MSCRVLLQGGVRLPKRGFTCEIPHSYIHRRQCGGIVWQGHARAPHLLPLLSQVLGLGAEDLHSHFQNPHHIRDTTATIPSSHQKQGAGGRVICSESNPRTSAALMRCCECTVGVAPQPTGKGPVLLLIVPPSRATVGHCPYSLMTGSLMHMRHEMTGPCVGAGGLRRCECANVSLTRGFPSYSSSFAIAAVYHERTPSL